MSSLKREASPLNLASWEEDNPDYRNNLDLLDPFLEESEHSLPNNEESLPLLSDLPAGEQSNNGEGLLARPSVITMDSRKRSSGSQLSDTGSGFISKRRKKPKGGPPKRPLSAYNLYFKAERTKIVELANRNGETIGFQGLAKIIGKQWRELSDEDRKTYEELAVKDQNRHREEMEAYNKMKEKQAEEDQKLLLKAPIAEVAVEIESKLGGQDQSKAIKAPASSRASTSSRSSSSEAKSPPGVAEAAGITIDPSSPQTMSREEYARLHEMTAPPAALNTTSKLSSSKKARSELLDCPPRSAASAHNAKSDHSKARMNGHASKLAMPGMERVMAHSHAVHMPPGMEIVLSDQNGEDRKYRVQYRCYSMSREEAQQYIDSVTNPPNIQQMSIPGQSPFVAPPPPHHQSPVSQQYYLPVDQRSMGFNVAQAQPPMG